jgi:uncharacterized protein YndB with AHSA1/START domain
MILTTTMRSKAAKQLATLTSFALSAAPCHQSTWPTAIRPSTSRNRRQRRTGRFSPRRSVTCCDMHLSDSLDIAAPPERVFSTLTDLPGMRRFSPENTGGEWLDGVVTARQGARFKGTNSQGDDSWSTIAKITNFEPSHGFAFDVTWHRFRISRWEFEVERTPGGCRVTEQWTDRRNAVIRKDGDSDSFSRVEFTKLSLRTTLERLKEYCEQPTS